MYVFQYCHLLFLYFTLCPKSEHRMTQLTCNKLFGEATFAEIRVPVESSLSDKLHPLIAIESMWTRFFVSFTGWLVGYLQYVLQWVSPGSLLLWQFIISRRARGVLGLPLSPTGFHLLDQDLWWKASTKSFPICLPNQWTNRSHKQSTTQKNVLNHIVTFYIASPSLVDTC